VKPQLLYRAIRLAFINGKYREQVNFTFEKIEAGFNTLNKLDETLKRLKQAKNTLESEINVTTQK
jgi:cysteinyl-tRNA synthetase